jgi:hypothetical protein
MKFRDGVVMLEAIRNPEGFRTTVTFVAVLGLSHLSTDDRQVLPAIDAVVLPRVHRPVEITVSFSP